MAKSINVQLVDAPMVHTSGEYVFDKQEGTLIVYGDQAANFITFNWKYIMFFTASEEDEDDE